MDAMDVAYALLDSAERTVRTVALDLQGEGQRRAPVETGLLRSTARTDIDRTDRDVTATVSFNTVYAARQHEELTWRHPRGGQAKYLESALMERAGRYEQTIAASAAETLRALQSRTGR